MSEKPKMQARDPHWEAAVRDTLAKQPLIETFQVTVDHLEPGICVLSMPFQPGLAQQNGFFQAGIVSALADNAGGMAARSLMPAGADVLAVEFKINFIAPAKGQRMVARGEVVKSGRTLSISTVTVTMIDGDRRTDCAVMQQTCMGILPA